MDQRDPSWRDQYAGGLKPDPDVEAALNGSDPPVSFRPAPVPLYQAPSQFGAFVKLR